MLKKSIIMAVICLLMAGSIAAQAQKPLPADKVMEAAYAKSKETNKNVMLIFHATWCSWCKRLEKAMDDPTMKALFEKYFVITYLDVLENGEKVAQFENPGGKAIMDNLGGAKSGIPFFAMIDKDAKTLATSNVMPKDSNIGYPGSFDEMLAFMKVIKTGAPKMKDDEAFSMIDFFWKNRPKQ